MCSQRSQPHQSSCVELIKPVGREKFTGYLQIRKKRHSEIYMKKGKITDNQ